MPLAVATRTRLLTAAVVGVFGFTLVLIIGGAVGWFDSGLPAIHAQKIVSKVWFT